ncbi:glycosyltransferase 87 family protein [Tessaracoccus antarcticus]|uniref:glycosyltransferase 87 family protein n=1 Tax=Tessaracoccus antarcticus TaxID=2479848 RepID=UPI001314B72F|nr:glycosyltransferase 87 family protein [Tessaracoccus antarcticus]
MFQKLTERYLASWPARLLAVAAALLVAAALTFWLPYTWPYRIDIDVYRLGGRAFLDGADLYGRLPDTEVGANLPFTYPPIAAALFSLFAIMPLRAASTLLSILSVMAMGWLLALVLREVTRRTTSEALWLALPVLALISWLGPMRENIEFGQINVLLMALVLTDVLAGQGKPWRGWLTGLAVAIKLTPAVFLVYFLLRRDWRSLIMTVVSFAVYTAIGFALRPADSVEYWTSALRDTGRIGNAGFPSNLSINGFVHRLGFDGTAASVGWFVVSAAVGLAIMWIAWKLLQADQKAAAALVVGFIALFCSPVSWGHHWVWALPMLVVFAVWAAQGIAPRVAWLVLLVTGAYIFWALPQWWFPSSEGETPEWNILQQLVGSAYLVWAAAALVVMAVFWRSRPVAVPAGN